MTIKYHSWDEISCFFCGGNFHGSDKVRASQKLDQANRGGRRDSVPSGQTFDPEYQPEHEAELATRKEAERLAREKKKAETSPQEAQGPPKAAQEAEAGPSTAA
jgi:hypothetical protein